jgi:RNA polymerase sigma-70 factor (ECF subfamily)
MVSNEVDMNLDAQVIWQQVHDSLRRFIAKRVSHEADVDDLLQEVFLRMHRKIDGLKDPRKMVSWLYQITRRAIVDRYRAPASRREQPAGLGVDFEAASLAPSMVPARSGPDSAELRAELARCLRPMIELLAPTYREAVMLVELQGLTSKAAAKKLGLSESGMKSRVQRGRVQLKRMLEACCTIQLDRRRGVVDYAVRDPRRGSCR